jgi:vesicular inhibitory amino acid transporter
MIKARRLTGSGPMSVGCINEPPPVRKTGDLSVRSACWTILTIYVGLGLLSKPYAIAKGGWVSIFLLAFFTWIAKISAQILLSIFDIPKCRTMTTYASIVDQVFGYWGSIFLIVLSTFELTGAICIYILFIWKNLETLMPHVPRGYIFLTSTAVILPTTWLIKLSEITFLSLLGFISSIFIIITLLFVRIYYGELGDVDLNNNFGPNIPLSMGIFALSLGGHIALPSIYLEMAKPKDIKKVLNISFTIIFIVYLSAGVLGYLIYGASCDIITSTNLIQNPGGVAPKVAATLIIVKNYLTVNPLISILCNSLEVMMGIEEARFSQQIFRSFAFLLTVAVSYLAHDALPFLESLVGGVCTMLTSYILPCILFAALKNKLMSWKSRCTNWFIVIFGFTMLVLLTYGSIGSLLHPD